MKLRPLWLALGLGAFLAFFLNSFPAATVLRWFAPADLRLAGVEGTVWSGQAALASVPGLPLRDVRWNVRGWTLLVGRLSGRVGARLADGFVDTEFSLPIFSAGSGSVTASQTRISTSLPTLRNVLPVSGALGQTSVNLDELVLEEGWPRRIVGTLRISGLQVEPFAGAGDTMIRLGDYEVTFAESPSPDIMAAIRDTGGPLELNGTLTLTPNREYLVEGSLATRPEAQRELIQGISIMLPEPDASGRRSFSFPGSL